LEPGSLSKIGDLFPSPAALALPPQLRAPFGSAEGTSFATARSVQASGQFPIEIKALHRITGHYSVGTGVALGPVGVRVRPMPGAADLSCHGPSVGPYCPNTSQGSTTKLREHKLLEKSEPIDDNTTTVSVLSAGTQVGHYLIIEKIGAGGMGEVYLAQDTRLERRVALKFMPAQFASDQDFVSRFRREAQAAARLDHPNIVTVHEVGEHAGRPFIAMQYVDGQNLHDLAHGTPLPMHRTIDMAIQICAGLQKAHGIGIVHRDIKTANILLDADRRPKIVDFGLATIQGGEKLTKIGSTIGTVAYMSPEQAQGAEVDQRSDLFSFGVVLYELVAGRTPFKRDSDAATLRAITQDTPEPLARYRANVPDDFQRIVNKLLQRDPALRYQTAGDVAADLKQLAISSSSGQVTPIVAKKRPLWPKIAIGVAVVVSVALLFVKMSQKSAPVPRAQVQFMPVTDDGTTYSGAISADGKYLALARTEGGEFSLSVRQVATRSMVRIYGPTEHPIGSVVFSPDGNYVYFLENESGNQSSLRRIATLGGTPTTILRKVDSRASWSPDGTRLAFARIDIKSGEFGIVIANADGSNEKTLISGKGAYWYGGSVSWSPDGNMIVCSKGEWKPRIHSELVAVQVADGKEVWHTSQQWMGIASPIWLPDGKDILVCASDQTTLLRQQIYLVHYPGATVERVSSDFEQYWGLTATQDGLTAGVSQGQNRSNVWIGAGTEWKQISNGKLEGMMGVAWGAGDQVFFASERTDATGIWKAASDGSNSQQVVVGDPRVFQVAVSPDGQSIAYSSFTSGVPAIWRADSDGKNAKALTADGEDYLPSFTPDGKWILFQSWRSGPLLLYRVPAMGGDLVKVSDQSASAPAISPDGKSIACFFTDSARTESKIGIMDFDSGKLVRTLPQPATAETGKLVWTRDGKGLIYIDTRSNVSNLMSLPIDGGPAKQLTNFTSDVIRDFGLAPDGKRFVLARGSSNSDILLLKDFR
jgi:eukaryotic-like serine/threonine-protein kinase